MLKQKTFNYITFILAVITIFMVVSTSRNNGSIWPCVVMLVITFIFSVLSRRYNDEMLYMNKKDKEALSQIEYVMKNGRVKKLEKNKIESSDK